MQSSSTMSVLSSGKDRTGQKSLRKGQARLIQYLRENTSATAINVHHPTGYGKTLGALIIFAELRQQKRFDRCLIVVPTTIQLDQYANELESTARMWGIPLRGVSVVDGTTRNVREHRNGLVEIFVTTIQAISAKQRSTNGFMLDLMSSGKWALIADEHHHYANGADWGEALKPLPAGFTMAMSATPHRMVGTSIFGFPTPGLSVTYREALEERAVKPLKARTYNFSLELEETDTGNIRTLTTDDLRKEFDLPDNLSKYEVQKEVRYLNKYVSPLFAEATRDLMFRRDRTGKVIQMLVYAMSCRHASSLCEQLREITPLNVDWAGTGPFGKTDDENRKITQSFKNQEIDVLIQVNLASEGFNSVMVGVICDLELIGLTPQKIQKYGRGSRIMPEVLDQYNYCRIYIPTDSALGDRDTATLQEIFDLEFENKDRSDNLDDRNRDPDMDDFWVEADPNWRPIDVQLKEIRELDESTEDFYKFTEALQSKGFHLDVSNPDHKKSIKAAYHDAFLDHDNEVSTKDRIEQWKRKIEKTISDIANHLCRVQNQGRAIPEIIGLKKREINANIKVRYGARDQLTEPELGTVYTELCRAVEKMREGQYIWQ